MDEKHIMSGKVDVRVESEKVCLTPSSTQDFDSRIRQIAQLSATPKRDTTLGQFWHAFRNVITQP